MDINSYKGSSYSKILLVSIFILFSLLVLRFWVLEIAICQGFVVTIQNIITSGQLTFLDGDANSIISGQNHVIFGLKRGIELLMVALFAYNIIYIFRYERSET